MRRIWQRLIRYGRRRRGKHDGGLLFRTPFCVAKPVRCRRARGVITMRQHAITARGTYSVTTVRRRLTLQRRGARKYFLVGSGASLSVVWVARQDTRP